MDAIEALTSRVSVGRLTAPAPSAQQRQLIFKAALRAADHGCLRPWRFLVVEADGLIQLGEVFVKSAKLKEPQLSTEKSQRYLNMPLRAPMIVVAISRNEVHAKVPVIEQQMAVAASVQNMITAAHALGVGAYWRTGAITSSAVVKADLGIEEKETIVGFIYMGTANMAPRKVPDLSTEDFFTSWHEPIANT